jgi:hypothetical protein
MMDQSGRAERAVFALQLVTHSDGKQLCEHTRWVADQLPSGRLATVKIRRRERDQRTMAPCRAAHKHKKRLRTRDTLYGSVRPGQEPGILHQQMRRGRRKLSECHSRGTFQAPKYSVFCSKQPHDLRSPLTESNRRPSPYHFSLRHCVLAGQRADLAEREHTPAPASPSQALASTACHSICHSK